MLAIRDDQLILTIKKETNRLLKRNKLVPMDVKDIKSLTEILNKIKKLLDEHGDQECRSG